MYSAKFASLRASNLAFIISCASHILCIPQNQHPCEQTILRSLYHVTYQFHVFFALYWNVQCSLYHIGSYFTSMLHKSKITRPTHFCKHLVIVFHRHSLYINVYLYSSISSMASLIIPSQCGFF